MAGAAPHGVFVVCWALQQTRHPHQPLHPCRTCYLSPTSLRPRIAPAEAVRLAIDGGTTIVQLREKRADGGPFLQQVGALRSRFFGAATGWPRAGQLIVGLVLHTVQRSGG